MIDRLANTLEGVDVLSCARAVLADAAHYSDEEIREACVMVLAHSEVPPTEKDEGRRMQRLARRAA